MHMLDRLKPGRQAQWAALCLIAGGALLTGASAWSGEAVKVGIDNFTFAPNVLSIAKGTEVTWMNHDDIPHSIVIAALSVRSKAMDTDGSFTYKFEKSGAFSYVCGLHPHMQAKVIVK